MRSLVPVVLRDQLNALRQGRCLSPGLLASVLVMSAAVLLPGLGAPTVQEWDEARHAQNALEIMSGGDWVVLRHRGEPDLWNLRPPMWAWVIAVSFALFGTSELSLRVGSALAGAGTAVLLCAWGTKHWGPAVGLAAAALLLSMKGFVIDHGARSGNCDVMVSFFITLALYRFWQAQQRGRAEIPPGTAVAVALGILVKGVVGLLPVPVIGLTVAWRERQLSRVFGARRTWVGAALLVGLVAPWAVARELAGSDFFLRMIVDDVLRRVSQPIEGHGGDALFYVQALKSGLGTSLFVAFVAVLASRVWRLREADWTERLLLVWIVLVVVALTVARTKLAWYLMPAYPAIALFVAGQAERWRLQVGWSVGRMAVILALLAAPAFGSVVSKIGKPQIDPCADAIRGSASVLKSHPAVYIFEGEATQSRFFYLSASGPQRVRALSSLESQIRPKGSIVTCDPTIRERLERADRFEEAHRVGELTIFRDRRSP